MLIEASEVQVTADAVLIDCRFSLTDVNAGRAAYDAGHIPGAHYLALDTDLSGPVQKHGGRHPLPRAYKFVAQLASLGIGPMTKVIAYDDSRLAFAARLWWMLRAVGYRSPVLLNGGYSGWLSAGGVPETKVPAVHAEQVALSVEASYTGVCAIDDLANLQAVGSILIDSREAARYQGLEEPIDPVAGHIPGAINRPWQSVTSDDGRVVSAAALRQHWGNLLDQPSMVVYCGSGVTACVNLFSLALLGHDDAVLYCGSWSDWCSYLET